MSMPPIADVKAAAEFYVRQIEPMESDPLIVKVDEQTRCLFALARFALAVLDAPSPGMSAERLAEIQRDTAYWAHDDKWDFSQPYGYERRKAMYDDANEIAVPELLAEVLRLRAQKVTAPAFIDMPAPLTVADALRAFGVMPDPEDETKVIKSMAHRGPFLGIRPDADTPS